MILVTGANGMVGSYFQEVFKDENLYLTDIDTLDVRDPKMVMDTIASKQPELVIHLAAETDVDKCEVEVDHAFKTNTIGTQNVTLACQKFDIELVYISTAGVFDGEKHEPYTEFDEPHPVNIYGRTKWEGEKIVQSLLNKYYIFRAGWMIGGGEKDKKFVGKIIRLMSEKNEISIVNDKFGSPTYAKELVIGIKEFIKTGYYGLYHMTNTGICSRLEIGNEIASFFKKNVKINPISSAAFPLPAPRARSEAMRNMKLDLLGMNMMSDWRKVLNDYLLEWAEIMTYDIVHTFL